MRKSSIKGDKNCIFSYLRDFEQSFCPGTKQYPFRFAGSAFCNHSAGKATGSSAVLGSKLQSGCRDFTRVRQPSKSVGKPGGFLLCGHHQ